MSTWDKIVAFGRKHGYIPDEIDGTLLDPKEVEDAGFWEEVRSKN